MDRTTMHERISLSRHLHLYHLLLIRADAFGNEACSAIEELPKKVTGHFVPLLSSQTKQATDI